MHGPQLSSPEQDVIKEHLLDVAIHYIVIAEGGDLCTRLTRFMQLTRKLPL
jgi:hypothetical protein